MGTAPGRELFLCGAEGSTHGYYVRGIVSPARLIDGAGHDADPPSARVSRPRDAWLSVSLPNSRAARGVEQQRRQQWNDIRCHDGSSKVNSAFGRIGLPQICESPGPVQRHRLIVTKLHGEWTVTVRIAGAPRRSGTQSEHGIDCCRAFEQSLAAVCASDVKSECRLLRGAREMTSK